MDIVLTPRSEAADLNLYVDRSIKGHMSQITLYTISCSRLLDYLH